MRASLRARRALTLPALAALSLLAVALAGCGGGAPGSDDDAARSSGATAAPWAGRNLLLITVDTLRADHLGAYGDGAAHTPALDALAAVGVRFAACYAPVPLTLPSHSVMLTGRSPLATGVHLNGVHYVSDAETTLAERFHAAGYATAATVSAYVLTSKFGLAQGFDAYDDRLTMDNVYRFYAEIPADEAVRRLRSWLDGRPAERPFFVWLHLYDPHQPYAPPAEWAERYPDDPYRGEVAFTDQQLGLLLDDLRSRGLAADTAVVVASDHGEAFGEHGEEGHGLLAYDETLHVPWIVAPPGSWGRTADGTATGAGRVIETRVSLYDVFPTLVGLFGLGGAAGGDGTDVDGALPPLGRDLTPVVLGAAPPPAADVYFETLAGHEEKNWAPLTGLVAGDLKYIRLPESELYDLAADPAERHNLFAARQQDAAGMERALRRRVEADAAGGGGSAERELTSEDRQRLAALGYLGGGAGRASKQIDPKRGIAVENVVREVRTLVQGGDAERAAAKLAELRAAHPDVVFSDFYELEFMIARERGESRAAVAALERGLERFPDSQPLILRLATYRQEIGDLDAAEQGAEQLLGLDPRNSQAHSLLGLISESRGELDQAASHFEAALALEPGSVPLRAKLAELALRRADTERARQLYDELRREGVLDHAPDQLARAGMLDVALGDLPRAEATFRRVLSLQDGGVHHLSLALILSRQGRTDEAAEEIRRALAATELPLDATQRQIAQQALGQLGAS